MKTILFFTMSLAVLSVVLNSSVSAATITVGQPDQDGGKVIWKINNKEIKIKIEPGTTVLGKAEELRKELKKKFADVTRDGAVVTLKNVGADKIEKHLDETAENDTVAVNTPRYGGVDFHRREAVAVATAASLAPFAGIDEYGMPSEFSASIGFTFAGQSYLATSEVSFGELSENSVDALLSRVYEDFLNDLPAEIGSSLELSLASEAVLFSFPPEAETGFVQSYTSDIYGYATMSIESVPDGGSTAMGLAAAALSLVSLKRKKTPRFPLT